MKLPSLFSYLGLCCGLILLAGCGQKSAVTEDGRLNVILQMDWYAQPEHGGFYHALAHGYYDEAGMNLELKQGLQNARPALRVAANKTQFSIGRSDDIIISIARGLPLLIVAAQMQHDPQGIMVHPDIGVEDFYDLDGMTVMSGPGSPFLHVLRTKYDIGFKLVALDGGMARFLQDKAMAQQCFVTSEPYYIHQKSGTYPKVLLLADIEGYDPYRVIYTNREFAEAHPEIVKGFVEASIRGWNDYLDGDRDKAEILIAKDNVKMADPEYRNFAYSKMLEYQLVRGQPEDNEAMGVIKPTRIQADIDRLKEMGLLEQDLKVEDVMSLDFLPEDVRAFSIMP